MGYMDDGGKRIKDETVNVLKSDYIFMFKT